MKTATLKTTQSTPERRKPGPRPVERVHLGVRISPRTMQRIDAEVDRRQKIATATSKNLVIEDLLAIALEKVEASQVDQSNVNIK